MYEQNEISTAMRVFWHLMQNGELSEDVSAELHKAYRDERIRNIVKTYAQNTDCSVEMCNNVIYLIPDVGNNFVGYSKAALKREICRKFSSRPYPDDKDYYLSQFIILTIIGSFYRASGGTSKIARFLKFGELINTITEKLKSAKEEEDVELLEKRSGLAFSNIKERWDALSGSEASGYKKGTKAGALKCVLSFMEDHNLLEFIEQDDMIRTTQKLDNFMDGKILNKSNYHIIQDAFREIEQQTAKNMDGGHQDE